MKIEFLSTVAVIAPDPPASRELYLKMLGLPLEGRGGDYLHSEQIAGCKSFGIWPLSQAAEACFGTGQWPCERQSRTYRSRCPFARKGEARSSLTSRPRLSDTGSAQPAQPPSATPLTVAEPIPGVVAKPVLVSTNANVSV